MEVDRTYTQGTSRNHHLLNHHMKPAPQGRGKEVGHETPGKEPQKMKQKRWVTPGERWRLATDRKQWRSLVDGQ